MRTEGRSDPRLERYGLVATPGRPAMVLGMGHGHWLSVCLTAEDRSVDATAQTREILQVMDAYLSQAGASRQSLLHAQIWVKEPGDVAAVTAVWNAWVDPAHAPAGSLVCADMARPEILVEIRLTAARG